MDSLRLADLSRRLESLIRTGTIAAVDLPAVRVRVASGGLTTQWLPWLEQRAASTSTWDPPVMGEQVLLLCPSGEPAAGVVLRGLHTDAAPPPSSSADEHVIRYPDGAVIQYNHASSALHVTGIKTATVKASELVTLNVPKTHITGDVTIDGDLLVLGRATITKLLSYLAGISGKAGAGVGEGNTIHGPIKQTGGGFATDGDVVAGNVSLNGHDHEEHGTGGGITSKPRGAA